MIQLQCPHCRGNKVSKTTMGKVTQGAAQLGGVVIERAVKVAADGMLFDGAGRLVPKFGNELASLAPLEYVCRECDCLFKTTFYTNGDIKEIALKKTPVPENLINEVRSEYIQTLRDKRPYVSMGICALITLYLLIYFFIGVAQDYTLRAVFSFFCAIPFAIPAIMKFTKINELNNEIAECEALSPIDFKRSHRDLFNNHNQYN